MISIFTLIKRKYNISVATLKFILLLLLSKTENGFKELVKQFSVQLLPSNTKIIKIIIIISISKQLDITRGKET